jgi:ubiquitin conjugation factor E4 B
MREPVTLPSGANVDRATARRLLLDSPTPIDPFNRQPLSEDKLIANSELQNRIHQWLQSKSTQLKKEEEDA